MRKIIMLSCSLALSACLSEKVGSSNETVPLPENHPPVGGTPTTKTSSVATTDVTLLSGDRFFIESTLSNVFMPSGASSGTITSFKTILNSTVHNAAPDFGGAANLYSTLGLKDSSEAARTGGNGQFLNESAMQISLMAPPTPARIAVLTDTCRQLSSNDTFLTGALNNISIPSPTVTAITEPKMLELYGAFSPGSEPSSEYLSGLNALIQILNTKTPALTQLEKWRGLVFVICADPYWQNF
jgi:hypothetical protein